MENGTTLLFGLPGVRVARVEIEADGVRVVHVVTAEEQAACPECGVFSSSVKENTTTRPKDLPYGEEGLTVRWHKRRWRCVEVMCGRGSFTEFIEELPPGARVTGRVLRAAGSAVGQANRAVSEVTVWFGISWPTANRGFLAVAAERLGEPEPVRVLGIDETRRGRPRWERIADGPKAGRWRLVDPWETGFVDLAGGGGLLGQIAGRTSRCVTDWLDARGQAFTNTVEVVAIDPSAPYARAVRTALPNARIVVDHFHLVALANKMATRVRQRVTQAALGHRGRGSDPAWVNRRLLLRGRERLSGKAFTRMWNAAVDSDESGELLAAWIAKEELRALMACARRGGNRHDIAHHAFRFFSWCASVDVPEVTTLAQTIEVWWPETLGFLQTGITNAGTEGTNRLIKQVKRTACGFRNIDHQRARVRFHCTRRRPKAPARNGLLPAQS